MTSLVLACDVGGTKTRLSLFEPAQGAFNLVRTAQYPSREHATLAAIIEAFLDRPAPHLVAAGFGIAGPVVNGKAHTTNLPWTVDGAELAHLLGLPSVSLLNDVETLAWSVEQLAPSDVVTLRAAASASAGNVAIIAAGTGLGLSALVRNGGTAVSLASEGGHADFAPRSELEHDLWGHLAVRFTHVSCERVLSGPGLVNVYEFLRDTHRGFEPDWLTDALRGVTDAAPTIAGAALDGSSGLCADALALFISIYGAEAGNWALRTLARGGLYLGGGIAPKLLAPAQVTDATLHARALFMAAFADKGRLSPVLEAMPVHVITNDQAPLLGSAHYALRIATA